MIRDNLHFNFRTIDGYNKPFNFVISEREAGKSTAMWLDKVYIPFQKSGATSLIIRRRVVDITDTFITDIENIINKFIQTPINLSYNKSSIKDGIVNVYVNESLMCRIVALSIPVSRLKSLILLNIQAILFDEFICALHLGERYLKGEAFKFKELYNTFQRENPKIKTYFMGNPYSLFNPYFLDFGIDTKKLKQGVILSGNNYVVQCYQICEDLKKMILGRNALYQFDDAYTKYAFDGSNIEDQAIKLGTKPNNFQLKLILKIENKYLTLWQNNYYEDMCDKFHVQVENKNIYSKNRNTYVLDFNEMIERTMLLSKEDHFKFLDFKSAVERRRVTFSTIEAYYLAMELYANI